MVGARSFVLIKKSKWKTGSRQPPGPPTTDVTPWAPRHMERLSLGTEWLISEREPGKSFPCPTALVRHPTNTLCRTRSTAPRRGKSEELWLKIPSPVMLDCSTVRYHLPPLFVRSHLAL
ncbi:hypothetical protein HPB47_028446 [Ixodes persulcatus]|uniref:Uncharacterized protein n=1 Tax=Ixodes persulcatus TaxID=34615 RepID=A0AC60PT61_IXOPE|nr:hypothetical protein HPB47_028446 [Ixodes persulcatus]